IRDKLVTGVQTCALPIYKTLQRAEGSRRSRLRRPLRTSARGHRPLAPDVRQARAPRSVEPLRLLPPRTRQHARRRRPRKARRGLPRRDRLTEGKRQKAKVKIKNSGLLIGQ